MSSTAYAEYLHLLNDLNTLIWKYMTYLFSVLATSVAETHNPTKITYQDTKTFCVEFTRMLIFYQNKCFHLDATVMRLLKPFMHFLHKKVYVCMIVNRVTCGPHWEKEFWKSFAIAKFGHTVSKYHLKPCINHCISRINLLMPVAAKTAGLTVLVNSFW